MRALSLGGSISGTEKLDSLSAHPASMLVVSCKIHLHSKRYCAALGLPIFKVPAFLGPHYLGAAANLEYLQVLNDPVNKELLTGTVPEIIDRKGSGQ